MTIEGIKNLFARYGYEFDQNINIFSFRTFPIKENKFEDVLYCQIGDVIKTWPVTTVPGLSSLKAPQNSAGTAILVPGQYKGVYAVDYHRGRYKALCQRLGEVKVYRDKNKDGKHDMNPKTIQTGYFGINIHKAGLNSILVDNWSAGCTVFKREKDFNEFMEMVESVRSKVGNRYTYTLFEAK